MHTAFEDPVYEEIWQTFLHGDHISAGAIWGGRGLALVIPLSDEITRRAQALQARLAGALPFCPHAPEVLHITLHLFGDLPPARQAAIAPLLAAQALKQAAFPIRVRRVNSFFRAPFLEVWDNGQLARLAAAVRQEAANNGFSVMAYGPRGQVLHVTLGAYTEAGDGAAARQLLQAVRDFEAGEMPVNELQLVETSEGKPYTMKVIERFRLKESV